MKVRSVRTMGILRFASYEVDLRSRELRRGGMLIRLHGQPFQVLMMLLERRGEVVTRQELRQQLWPDETFVDFDHSLNTAVNKLREALGDSADNPRFVQTLPRRGYRFIAQVSETSGSVPTTTSEKSPTDATFGMRSSSQSAAFATSSGGRLPALTAESSKEAPAYSDALAPGSVAIEPRSARLPKLAALSVTKSSKGTVLGVALAATLIAFGWFGRPAAIPRVVRVTQLTDFGLAWSYSKIVTDGTRLYFVRRQGAVFNIVQTALGGGEPLSMPTNLSAAILYDISPDHTSLLLGGSQEGWKSSKSSVWIVPLAGGTPRRLGDVTAGDAVWAADGREIFLAKDSALYTVSNDGAEPRKLIDLPGEAVNLSRSVSGTVLRFSVRDPRTGSFSLWETSTDGSNLRPLLKGWKPDPGWLGGELAGTWTRDGKYYLFTSTREGRTTLFAIREEADLLHRSSAKPVPLYEGTLFLSAPLVAADAGKIFIVGDEPESRELLRYEERLKRFEPFLQGMPARWVKFSPDGAWVTYVRASDLTLWRSRADGRDRLQLTFTPLRAFTPDWSPDSKFLCFAASVPGNPANIYTLSRDGGLPQLVLADRENAWDPNWLEDGKTIIFGRMAPSYEFGSSGIYRVDMQTKRISLVPGSRDFTKPAVSPKGRYVAAFTADGRTLMLFDSKSGQWDKLAQGKGLQNLYWSRDGGRIFFQDVHQGREQPIQSVRIGSRRVEQIANSDQLLRSDVRVFALTGLALDGSPLVTLIRGKADVYALDVELP